MNTKGLTPWSPCPIATGRVAHPRPAPTECPLCQGSITIRCPGDALRASDGLWPWLYTCTQCAAEVGMHPCTAIPLGTLAQVELARRRKYLKLSLKALYLTGLLSLFESHLRFSRVMGYRESFCNIDELTLKDTLPAYAAIESIYIAAISRQLQPVLVPDWDSGRLEFADAIDNVEARYSGEPRPDNVLKAFAFDEWAVEDLVLARRGQLLPSPPFEVAPTPAAFQGAYPAALAEDLADFKRLVATLMPDDAMPSTAGIAFPLIDYGWEVLGRAMFSYRVDILCQQFAGAMPVYWGDAKRPV